jgi:hypothetical protein
MTKGVTYREECVPAILREYHDLSPLNAAQRTLSTTSASNLVKHI